MTSSSSSHSTIETALHDSRNAGVSVTVIDWINDNAKAVISLIGILVTLAVGFAGYRAFHSSKQMDAQEAFFLGRYAIEKQMREEAESLIPAVPPLAKPKSPSDASTLAAQEAAKSPSKDSKEAKEEEKLAQEHQKKVRERDEAVGKKLGELLYAPSDGETLKKKYGSSLEKIEKVSQNFAKTRAAYEAEIWLGDFYLNHNQAPLAISHFEKAILNHTGAYEQALAAYSLGTAYENSGKWAEAQGAYEKSILFSDIGLRGEILLALARMQEQLQQKDRAKATYDQIIQQLPNTDYSRTAQALKARLES
jgi:TolA-binding protein